jgi:polyphosphate kinase 2
MKRRKRSTNKSVKKQHTGPGKRFPATDTLAPSKSPHSRPSSTALLKEENRQLRERLDQYDQFTQDAVRIYRNNLELEAYQAELIRMQQCLEKRGKKMIILLEGRGGSGKSGAINRIIQYMNAKHYRVVALGKPTEEEQHQWFYQKYIQAFPRAGEIVLFDRSWYTRALMEPVFGFCSDKEYKDFIAGVEGFEKDLIRQNIILIKLYFSITRDEQQRRFNRRRNDPLQSWKLNELDLDEEGRRDEFTEAKYRMLKSTHSHQSPWTIIRSDDKHLARLNAIKVILNSTDYEPMNPLLDFIEDPTIAVSGSTELERMEAQRIRLKL